MKKVLFYTLILLTIIGCTASHNSDVIQTADEQLWTDPDSCLRYCQPYLNQGHKDDTKRIELIYQHAYFKVTGEVISDSTLKELRNHFYQQKNYRCAGEADYLLGAYYVYQGKHMEATLCLKEAETEYNLAQLDSPKLLGMLYFYLGAATERSRFFDVAGGYYEKALPYLKRNNNPIYVSSAFHHLAKCNTDFDSVSMYLDSAYHYALIAGEPLYKKEIEVFKSILIKPTTEEDINAFVNNLYYLCDTCQLHYYSAYLVKIFIERNQIDLANKYLQKLAQDTAKDIWNAEQYYNLLAELQYKQDDVSEAYFTIKNLHERQTADIENSAYASTYIISQRYDAAKEQELRLQEEVKKQHAYMLIVVVLLLCFVAGGCVYYLHKRSLFRLQLSEAEQKRMRQELEANRHILRTRINERLEVARQLRAWESRNSESISDTLNILVPQRVKQEKDNWNQFYDEFNLCYGNMLSRLKDEHPELIDPDLQYIALAFLGLDLTDMRFLLGVGKRTIWNRRSALRQHLGLPEDANLDQWITHDMAKEYGITEL